MIKRSIIPAALVVMLAAGTAQSQDSTQKFEQPYWTERPVVEAVGRALIELPPNRGTFSVKFVETDGDAKDAMQAAVERARNAYAAIKSVSGDDSEVTTSVQVEPYFEQYRDRDGDRVENRRADKVKGYQAVVTVNVLVKDVELAGEARAAALALGPEEAGSLRLYLQRTAQVLQQAYQAAVSDGAARAQISATAANSKLGKLLVVQEGRGPCLGTWYGRAGVKENSFAYDSQASVALETVSVTASARERLSSTVSQADIDALILPSDRPKEAVEAQVCMIYAVDE